jgi:hypothetical protein
VPPTPSPAATGGEGGQTQGGVLTGKRVLIGLVILAVIGAGAGLGIALTGKSTAAGASEVFLQPKDAQGQNPFTPNVGTDASVPSTASGALTPTSGTSLASYSGNSVGLYGGTLDQSSCNPQQMVTYLEANPSKASAWAAAEGISVTQVSSYIGGLTPMTLRYDTRVTNHGYVNGQANAIPEILQAGQAVLVDSHGVPRARCYCGNPLTPPEAVAGSPQYVGAQWSEFSPATVIVVQQSTTVINNFTLISNTTGQAFTRPSGTSGTSDTPSPTCNNGPSMPGVTFCTNPTTTTPTTTPKTTACTPGSSVYITTISCLNGAVTEDAQAGGITGAATDNVANCGPPNASFTVGTDIACGLSSPSAGSAMMIVQLTDTAPGFTVAFGVGSAFPCDNLNSAEQAALTADGDSCFGPTTPTTPPANGNTGTGSTGNTGCASASGVPGNNGVDGVCIGAPLNN